MLLFIKYCCFSGNSDELLYIQKHPIIEKAVRSVDRDTLFFKNTTLGKILEEKKKAGELTENNKILKDQLAESIEKVTQLDESKNNEIDELKKKLTAMEKILQQEKEKTEELTEYNRTLTDQLAENIEEKTESNEFNKKIIELIEKLTEEKKRVEQITQDNRILKDQLAKATQLEQINAKKIEKLSEIWTEDQKNTKQLINDKEIAEDRLAESIKQIVDLTKNIKDVRNVLEDKSKKIAAFSQSMKKLEADLKKFEYKDTVSVKDIIRKEEITLINNFIMWCNERLNSPQSTKLRVRAIKRKIGNIEDYIDNSDNLIKRCK